MAAPDYGLVRVVSIQIQAASAEDLCKDVARRSHTLPSRSSNPDSEGPLHTPSLTASETPMSKQSAAQAQLKMRMCMEETANRNFQFDYLTSRNTTLRMRPHAPGRSKHLYLDGNMYDSSMSARS